MGRPWRAVGAALCAAGAVIVLAMRLPSVVGWALFGAILVTGGILILRGCC